MVEGSRRVLADRRGRSWGPDPKQTPVTPDGGLI
jgi:hypothetical protein